MPKKAKPKTEPEAKAVETKPVEAKKEQPRGTKTAAIKAALKVNRNKGPKEIAELLKADGWDVKPQQVSVVKSYIKGKTKGKKAAPAAAPEAAAPALPKDAVSVGLLVKAKKLVQELGGIKEAKNALKALAQLMD